MTQYSENEYFRLNIKKLIVLAVVPVDEGVATFDLIANQSGDDADDLLDYFEKTWIGKRIKSGMLFFYFSPNLVHPRLFRRQSQESAI